MECFMVHQLESIMGGWMPFICITGVVADEGVKS